VLNQTPALIHDGIVDGFFVVPGVGPMQFAVERQEFVAPVGLVGDPQDLGETLGFVAPTLTNHVVEQEAALAVANDREVVQGFPCETLSRGVGQDFDWHYLWLAHAHHQRHFPRLIHAALGIFTDGDLDKHGMLPFSGFCPIAEFQNERITQHTIFLRVCQELSAKIAKVCYNIEKTKVRQKRRHMHRKRDILLVPFLILIAIMITGTLIFSRLEGWSIIDSLYFVVTSITTVGYGDLTPTQDVTKIAVIIFNLISIPLALSIFALVAEFYFEKRVNDMEHHFQEIFDKKK